jgi:hypothetical protein
MLMLLLAKPIVYIHATQRLVGKFNISVLEFEILLAFSVNINASLVDTGNKAKKPGNEKS